MRLLCSRLASCICPICFDRACCILSSTWLCCGPGNRLARTRTTCSALWWSMSPAHRTTHAVSLTTPLTAALRCSAECAASTSRPTMLRTVVILSTHQWTSATCGRAISLPSRAASLRYNIYWYPRVLTIMCLLCSRLTSCICRVEPQAKASHAMCSYLLRPLYMEYLYVEFVCKCIYVYFTYILDGAGSDESLHGSEASGGHG